MAPSPYRRNRVMVRAKKKNPPRCRGGFSYQFIVSRMFSVLGRPGSDLLFQALRLSTIGAGEFNGRVRDGIGFRPPASTTRSAKNGKRTCCPRGLVFPKA